MKLLKLLIIAFFVIIAGCTEPDDTNDFFANDMQTDEYLKSAKDGTVTIKIFSRLTSVSDAFEPGSGIICEPYPRELPVTGYLSGRITHLGRLNEEESLFEKISCSTDFSTGVPIFFTIAEGQAVGMSGDILFREMHSWVNIGTRTVTGFCLIKGGTGKFEGAEGRLDIVSGKLNPDNTASYSEMGTVTLVKNKNKYTD